MVVEKFREQLSLIKLLQFYCYQTLYHLEK